MGRPHISTLELLLELGRELFATTLVIALIIPAVFIHVVSTISAIIIRRCGGLD